MTPAELKTLRESLGLTAQWIAQHVGVQKRTVQYWEVGRTQVPEGASGLLEAVEARIDELYRSLLAQAQAQPDQVCLVRYHTEFALYLDHPEFKPMPLTTYVAVLARVRQALREAGRTVRITYQGDSQPSKECA